ncbi:MAG TPA: PaaX family transcriptional regulator C-terminal domain-containing protein [Steroidobacteraceae bacterium]|nr:PaaX family transcriptional regulator C-terminal domain-containing protein [Steroidobacteraceae bacterium]
MPAKPSRLSELTRGLILRLHRQRPLRAGSLLTTILGDSIAPRGGAVSLRSLIKLAMPFGLPERLIRTSAARLAEDHWVASQRIGRESVYRLTASGSARFAEATERIYAAPPLSWDGEWTLIVIPPTLKTKRDSLRAELGWLGFGQLTPGLFAHPTHKEGVIRSRVTELQTSGKLVVIQKAVVTQASDRQLIEMGWNLVELTRRYRRFIQLYGGIGALMSECAPHAVSEETSFAIRTLMLHEYRKIHLRDPWLPSALLPQNWSGTEAYELCRKIYAAVFLPSERYLTAMAETMTGALPPPSAQLFERFGGLPSERLK